MKLSCIAIVLSLMVTDLLASVPPPYPEEYGDYSFLGGCYEGSGGYGKNYPGDGYPYIAFPGSGYQGSGGYGNNYPDDGYPYIGFPGSGYQGSGGYGNNYPDDGYPYISFPGSGYQGSGGYANNYPGDGYPYIGFPGFGYQGSGGYGNNYQGDGYPYIGFPGSGYQVFNNPGFRYPDFTFQETTDEVDAYNAFSYRPPGRFGVSSGSSGIHETKVNEDITLVPGNPGFYKTGSLVTGGYGNQLGEPINGPVEKICGF